MKSGSRGGGGGGGGCDFWLGVCGAPGWRGRGRRRPTCNHYAPPEGNSRQMRCALTGAIALVEIKRIPKVSPWAAPVSALGSAELPSSAPPA